MAVVSVQPLHERRRSSYRDQKTVHNLLWLVTCDAATDGPATAIVAAGVPQPGSAFVNVDGSVAYLSGIDVDVRGPSDRHFEVMVEFTTLGPNDPDDNPLNQPWGFTFSYQDTTENYFIDQSTNGSGGVGVTVVNAAGEAFEQFYQRESGVLTITMTRNEATHDAAADDQYSNTVNEGDVTLDSTENACEVNGTRGIDPGTIVRLTFSGYNSDGTPRYMFGYTPPAPDVSLIPHDHRDNAPNSGGYAFAIFHPGTSIPQQNWGV